MPPTALRAPPAAGGLHLYYRHPGRRYLSVSGRARPAGIDVQGRRRLRRRCRRRSTRAPAAPTGGRHAGAVVRCPPRWSPPASRTPAPAVTAPTGRHAHAQRGGHLIPDALLAAHLDAVRHAPKGSRRTTLYGAARGVARHGRRRTPSPTPTPSPPSTARRPPAPEQTDRESAPPSPADSETKESPHEPAHHPNTGPIDGAAILDRLHATITRYVVLPSPEAVDAVMLWIAATHAQPAWAHAPRLVIRAPEKRCGKSRLLDVVEGTCHNPLITVNASPAAVYRSIGTDDPPTLLVDEADTIFGGEERRSQRGPARPAQRRSPAQPARDPLGQRHSHRLEKIPTFAMAALAGIGAMPDTIEDRAVVIRMRRRAAGEKVAPYRHRRDGPGSAKLAASGSDVAHGAPRRAGARRARPCRSRTAPPTPGSR